jgi:DNA (cytosine-5)-methyltransferase 1
MIHRAISLFSNCGAGDVGYAQAGFEFDVMAELDKRRLEVCLLNHPGAVGIAGDLRETWRDVVKAYRKKAGMASPALVAACPPCQGMSSARSDRGLETDPDAGTRDKRNLLVTVISQVVKSLKPKIVVVENVQAFLTRKIRHPRTGKPTSAARYLMHELQDDYVVFPFLVDLCDYGVPQTRKRTFLTFVRNSVTGLKFLQSEGVSPYPLSPADARPGPRGEARDAHGSARDLQVAVARRVVPFARNLATRTRLTQRPDLDRPSICDGCFDSR